MFPFALFAAVAVNHVRRADEEDERRTRRDAERHDSLSTRQEEFVESVLRETDRHHAALRMAKATEKADLQSLCESLGIRLREEAMDDGLCGWIETHRSKYEDHYVIVVNRSHAETRRRFTIAHMLGHHYYHRDMFDRKAKHGANADRGCDQKRDAPWFNPMIDAACKRRANNFAVGLLMPHDTVRRLMREGLDAEAIADRLCITVTAAEIRMKGIRG
jgi:Zn-dependent peptidase ImmA (M78 family)